MYQRSLGVEHPPVADQDVEGSTCSKDETPLAKRRRTTAQDETGILWLHRYDGMLVIVKIAFMNFFLHQYIIEKHLAGVEYTHCY